MDQATVGATSEPADQRSRPADQAGTQPLRSPAAGPIPGGRPLLSVVIPCYNEVATIASLIERVRRAPVASKQIIVVDDGSSDGTRELLAGLQGDDLTILYHPQNQGKGAALPFSGRRPPSGGVFLASPRQWFSHLAQQHVHGSESQ